MRPISLWSSSIVVLFTLSIPACNIESHHNSGCPGDRGANDGSLCGAFCDRLVTCGSLRQDRQSTCIEACRSRGEQNPAATEEGARCVVQDACREPDDYDCPGAPLPSTGTTTTTTSTTATGTGGFGGEGTGGAGGSTSSGGGAGGGAPACTSNHDCGPSEDCVSDACHLRCEANCDCPESYGCHDGYCFVAGAR